MKRSYGLYAFIAIFLVFTVSTVGLFSVQRGFTQETFYVYTDDGVRVVFDVIYTDDGVNVSDKPLAVFIHGFSANRKSMKVIALELAEQGFVTVLIDLRGHGDSDGYMISVDDSGDARVRLYSLFERDIDAVIGFINQTRRGDLNRLVLIGHSMGGGTVIYYGARHSSVIGTIAIAPGFVVSDLVNVTSPKNLLLVASLNDKIVSTDSVANVFYRSINGSGEFNKVYDFNGSKRMLYVDNDASHLSEVSDPDIIKVVVKWACNVTNINFSGLKGYFRTLHRLSVLSFFSGLILVAMIFPYLVRAWGLTTSFKGREIGYRKFSIVSISIYLGGSILGFVLGTVVLLLLRPFSPLAKANFTVSFILGTSLAQLLSVYLVYWKLYGFSDNLPMLLKKFFHQEDYKVLVRTTLIYTIPLISLLYVTVGLNIFLTFSTSSVHLTYLPLFLVLMFFAMYFDEIVFRYFSRPRLESRAATIIVSSVYNIVLRSIVILTAIFMVSLLLNLNFWFLYAGFILLIYIWSAIIIIAEVIREYSGNMVTQSIVNAVLMATLVITFTPAMHP